MRSFHKGWQDKRGPGWTRRVWLYLGQEGEAVRVKFSDVEEHREFSQFYMRREDAERDYERFVAGERVRTFVRESVEALGR